MPQAASVNILLDRLTAGSIPNYAGAKISQLSDHLLVEFDLPNSALKMKIKHVKAVVAVEFRAILPEQYHRLAASDGDDVMASSLPVSVSLGKFRPGQENPQWRILNDATLDKTIEKHATIFEYPFLLFDLRNNGDQDARAMLKETFRSTPVYGSTTTTVKCRQGLVPRKLYRWDSFEDEVLGQKTVPAMTPLHRTVYKQLTPMNGEAGTSVVQVVENTAFLLVNAVYKGTPIRYLRRCGVPVVGEPDLMFVKERKMLIPIDTKPLSVLPGLIEDICGTVQDDIAKLASIGEHRYHKLNIVDSNTWDAIVGGNDILSSIIQIFGYSCANKSRYAVLTNGVSFWFLRRDDDGGCAISDGVTYLSETTTVVECLNYLASAAMASAGVPSPLDDRDFEIIPQCVSQVQLIGCKGRDSVAVYNSGDLMRSIDEGDIMVDQNVDSFEGRFCSLVKAVILTDTVALKMLDLFKCDEEAVANLQNELDIYVKLTALQGTVIPRLVGYGTLVNGAVAFVATAWIEGHELGQQPSDKHLLGKAKIAFRKLHDAGYIHGDVAPRNVIVTPTDEIRIIDFDCASPVDVSSETAETTETEWEVANVVRMFASL